MTRPGPRPRGRSPPNDYEIVRYRAPMSRSVRYTHGHGPAALASHSRRTAATSCAYLLPHLRSGLNLLDVGCGPATVTADLAGLVAPGRVVGLDAAPAAIEAARATLIERHLTDAVELTSGDVHDLPFADNSFDVVHAHQLLQHVADPVHALEEIRRVTRPGGLVAVRDSIYSAKAWFPQPEGLEMWRQVYLAVARANGGEPDAGSRLLSWCLAAGLTQVASSASTWCLATAEDRAWWARTWAERPATSLGPQAIALGLAAQEDLEAMTSAWQQWQAADDGWFVVVHGEALARVE